MTAPLRPTTRAGRTNIFVGTVMALRRGTARAVPKGTVTALLMVGFTKRYGAPKVHALCLTLSGMGMWFIPQIQTQAWLFLPAIGVGLGWASIMGNPYVMLARSVPPERTGVYMGIFNMLIVIPLLLGGFIVNRLYDTVFAGDPRNVLMMSGVLMVCAALATLRVKVPD